MRVFTRFVNRADRTDVHAGLAVTAGFKLEQQFLQVGGQVFVHALEHPFPRADMPFGNLAQRMFMLVDQIITRQAIRNRFQRCLAIMCVYKYGLAYW